VSDAQSSEKQALALFEYFLFLAGLEGFGRKTSEIGLNATKGEPKGI
jgi:hypothetical protein